MAMVTESDHLLPRRFIAPAHSKHMNSSLGFADSPRRDRRRAQNRAKCAGRVFRAVPEPNFSCLPATKNGKLRRYHLCFLASHYDWLEFPTLLLSLETPADVKQDSERGNGPVNRVGMWEAKLHRRA
jgi:hypothetical protein